MLGKFLNVPTCLLLIRVVEGHVQVVQFVNLPDACPGISCVDFSDGVPFFFKVAAGVQHSVFHEDRTESNGENDVVISDELLYSFRGCLFILVEEEKVPGPDAFGQPVITSTVDARVWWSHRNDSLYDVINDSDPKNLDWGNVTLTGWDGETAFAAIHRPNTNGKPIARHCAIRKVSERRRKPLRALDASRYRCCHSLWNEAVHRKRRFK